MPGTTATPPRGCAQVRIDDDDDDTAPMPIEKVVLECGRERWPLPGPLAVAAYLTVLAVGAFLMLSGLGPEATIAGETFLVPAIVPAFVAIAALELVRGAGWLSSRVEITTERTRLTHGILRTESLLFVKHEHVLGVKTRGDDVVLVTEHLGWILSGVGERAATALREVLPPHVPFREEKPVPRSRAPIIGVLAATVLVLLLDGQEQLRAHRVRAAARAHAAATKGIERAIERAMDRYRAGVRLRERARAAARLGRQPDSLEERAFAPRDLSVRPNPSVLAGVLRIVPEEATSPEPLPIVSYHVQAGSSSRPLLQLQSLGDRLADDALLDALRDELRTVGADVAWPLRSGD